MSGPVTNPDGSPIECPSSPEADAIEVRDGREADVGGSPVRRLLPFRDRRTVGAWCFADHFGPIDGGLAGIGPHPHMGLQTVTWLLSGSLLHKDTLGSEQLIRPGQLNLMTAGRGVAHSEEAPTPRSPTGHGVQLWVAQPEATRHGDAAFEHHDELPQTEVAGAVGSVFVGRFHGTESPARADTKHMGTEITLTGDAELPLAAGYEHALISVDGAVEVNGQHLGIGQVAYLPVGRSEVGVHGESGSRLLLVGGEPWDERITMWWNFVGRSKDEMAAAYQDWQADRDRFGTVASDLTRIPSPPPPWLREA